MATGAYDDVLLRHLTITSFSLHTALFRRDVMAAIGFVPGGDEGSAPDFSIFTELGAERVRAYYLAERLGRYRVHPHQTTRNRVLMVSSVLDVLRRLAVRGDLTPDERYVLAGRIGMQVVELAIAQAQSGRRRAALRTITRLRESGGRTPRVQRLVVLAALLLGARRRPRQDGGVVSEGG